MVGGQGVLWVGSKPSVSVSGLPDDLNSSDNKRCNRVSHESNNLELNLSLR